VARRGPGGPARSADRRYPLLSAILRWCGPSAAPLVSGPSGRERYSALWLLQRRTKVSGQPLLCDATARLFLCQMSDSFRESLEIARLDPLLDALSCKDSIRLSCKGRGSGGMTCDVVQPPAPVRLSG
jgi:hypothetical protein